MHVCLATNGSSRSVGRDVGRLAQTIQGFQGSEAGCRRTHYLLPEPCRVHFWFKISIHTAEGMGSVGTLPIWTTFIFLRLIWILNLSLFPAWWPLLRDITYLSACLSCTLWFCIRFLIAVIKFLQKYPKEGGIHFGSQFEGEEVRR